MRATLDIDADILKAAKVLAEAGRKTLGQVLSELVRKGLEETTEGSGLSGEVGLPRSMESGQPHSSRSGAPAKRKR
jgi:hypothetical protein